MVVVLLVVVLLVVVLLVVVLLDDLLAEVHPAVFDQVDTHQGDIRQADTDIMAIGLGVTLDTVIMDIDDMVLDVGHFALFPSFSS